MMNKWFVSYMDTGNPLSTVERSECIEADRCVVGGGGALVFYRVEHTAFDTVESVLKAFAPNHWTTVKVASDV